MRALLTLLAAPLCVAAFAAPAAAQIGQPGVPSPESAQAQGQTSPAPTAADVADLRVSQVVDVPNLLVSALLPLDIFM